MRPRGSPPTPSAMSRPSDPVGMTRTSGAGWSSPRRMIEPLPNCFSIELTASSIAFSRWSAIGLLAGRTSFYLTGVTEDPGQREPEQRYVLGTTRFHDAFVQDHLAHHRGPEVGLPEGGKDLPHAAGRVLDPADGDVRRERPGLAGKAEL